MIGLLKKLEGSDVRCLELPETLCRLRGQIHIDAPDLAGADLCLVNGCDGVENVLKSFGRQRLPGDHQNSLVALADQDASLFRNLFLRERAALEISVCRAESAVRALVRAAVGDVKRREQDQPRSVNLFLDLLCRREDFSKQLRTFDKGKAGYFLHGKPVHLARFHQQFTDL